MLRGYLGILRALLNKYAVNALRDNLLKKQSRRIDRRLFNFSYITIFNRRLQEPLAARILNYKNP
jgi:hypothetical protein